MANGHELADLTAFMQDRSESAVRQLRSLADLHRHRNHGVMKHIDQAIDQSRQEGYSPPVAPMSHTIQYQGVHMRSLSAVTPVGSSAGVIISVDWTRPRRPDRAYADTDARLPLPWHRSKNA